MESKYKSKCPSCGEFIYVGDEIVQAGSGRWVHEHCPVVTDNNYFQDPLVSPPTKKIHRSMLHAKIDLDKPKKCLNCGNKTFLTKRLETIVLDDGEKFTTKIFTCDKCFFIMRYVEK